METTINLGGDSVRIAQGIHDWTARETYRPLIEISWGELGRLRSREEEGTSPRTFGSFHGWFTNDDGEQTKLVTYNPQNNEDCLYPRLSPLAIILDRNRDTGSVELIPNRRKFSDIDLIPPPVPLTDEKHTELGLCRAVAIATRTLCEYVDKPEGELLKLNWGFTHGHQDGEHGPLTVFPFDITEITGVGELFRPVRWWVGYRTQQPLSMLIRECAQANRTATQRFAQAQLGKASSAIHFYDPQSGIRFD